jgi:aminopeptidase-like protein
LDDLSLVTFEGMDGAFTVLKKSIKILENKDYPKSTVLCEPQLSKKDVYPTSVTKESVKQVKTMMNLISHCDGNLNFLEITEFIEEPLRKILPIIEKLKKSRFDCFWI